ncbi:MAG: hypothetical protein DRG78_14960 [Epsilonproteobacteria bacterium]|nr:MAG: hypothetical protein DRG78_14960 [Campylobacterota bacterium]
MEKLLQHQRHNIILERLRDGEILSIVELAREWGIITKTVSRDFKKLSEGSYSIIRLEDGKRFAIVQDYSISKSTHTAISMLDSLSSDIGGAFYTKAQSALHKLQKDIDSPFYTRIDVEDISHKLDTIEALESAIKEQKMVTFGYKKWYAPEKIKRYEDVKPYKIIIFDGFWYLLTQYKQHYIKFYLKEIQNLKIVDKRFVHDKLLLDRMDKALNIWFDPGYRSGVEYTLLTPDNLTTKVPCDE